MSSSPKVCAATGPVVAVPAPAPGIGVMEPHAAIDSRHVDRMAVAAMACGDKVQMLSRSLHVWQSSDGGSSWNGTRLVSPQFDDEGAFDPLVAFTNDGTLLVICMSISAQTMDALAAGVFERASIPALDKLVEKISADVAEIEYPDTVVAVRVDENGTSLGGTILEGSGGADKPIVVVDEHPGSPFSGTIYVAWHDMAKFGMLRVARSSDGGRTFGPPVPLVDGPPWGNFMAQFAVRSDGSLHVVWTAMVAVLESAPDGADTSVWHAVSHDGGQTFSTPAPIATHPGLPLIGLPSLGIDPEGRMLVIWGQGSAPPAGPLSQVRHRLYGIRSDDGRTWTEPELVSPNIPATTSLGLPAVVGNGQYWWVLTYLADDEGTEVALLRSDDGGATFEPWRTLARRPIPVDDIFLNGNYMLRRCTDVVQVGDYVGLTMTGSRLVAAFVLPESDDPMSATTCYTTVIDV